ncbi:hypothetical protein [Candidatus Thiosymbion oneisti]|uniref:hypothetical protein n=1 Tax=Candidatus Thiosymbion oneisti TaxID=589554 RepID=UPI00114CE5DB|nr:hypothetical protein [Candidatus Thiosymbion oneisti]
MNRAAYANRQNDRSAASLSRCLALILLVLIIAGCTAPTTTREPSPATVADAKEYRSPGIRIRLINALRAGDRGTLLESPGWVEYVFAIDNTGSRPLTVHDVKLLNADGRYLAAADSYEQIIAPPSAGGQVAASTAGAAVGQVIPFGGAIVGIISDAISASTAQSREDAKRAFERHKLKAVELAPAGKITGSACLPDLAANQAKALVISYGHGDQTKQIEIRLSRRGA